MGFLTQRYAEVPELSGFTARQWHGCVRALERFDDGDKNLVPKFLKTFDVSPEQWDEYFAWAETRDGFPPTDAFTAPPPPPPTGPQRRLVLNLPSQWDPVGGIGIGQALKLAADREPDIAWQPESVANKVGGWVLTLAADPDDAPGLQHVDLGADVKPADAPRLAAHFAAEGRQLLSFEPYAHRATTATLLPFVAKLREQIATYLRLAPWDIQVAVRWKPSKDGDGPWEVSTLTVDGPLTAPADKRRQVWTDLADDLIPAVAETTWWVDDFPQEGRVILRRQEDPLGKTLDYPWGELISHERVPFGLDIEGNLIELGLLERNVLIGGSPGAGKSGGSTCLLCGIARLPHTAIIGIDPKQVELAPWGPRMSYIANERADVSRVLRALEMELYFRYAILKREGKKKFSPNMLTDELPLLVVVIDELADLVSVGATKEDKDSDAGRATLIRRLIALGRACAIVFIVMTQKPAGDTVPTNLRDIIQLRVSYATTNSAMTETILGAGATQKGGLAHEIPASLSGVCYVIDGKSRDPKRGRTFWVEDNEVEEIAERFASLRVDLPWLTAAEPPFAEEDGPVVVRPTHRPTSTPPAEPIEIAAEFSLAELEAAVVEPTADADAVVATEEPWA